MSDFNGYKTKSFSDSQKFFVLDPSTGTPSFVLGSDLVKQLTPNSNYVFSESTRSTAQATDYPVGSLIQTAGAVTAGDNLASGYLVVAAGQGDFPMDNGNELLVISGDDALREQLISNAVGEGSDLVAYTGTSDTVTEALDKRTIYVGSVAEGVSGLSGVDGVRYEVSEYQQGTNKGKVSLKYDASRLKSDHDGVFVFSPTVPSVSTQTGTTLAARTNAYRSGAGETDATGTGVFVAVDLAPLSIYNVGIYSDPIGEDDQSAALQAFYDNASGGIAGIGDTIRVGIASPVFPKSNSLHFMQDMEIFLSSTYSGEAGFAIAVRFENVVNHHSYDGKLNGNADAFGGLFPVNTDTNAPRGVAVLDGCDNIQFINWRNQDVSINSFLVVSGAAGSANISKNITLERCVSKNCGIPMGQEVNGTDGIGPQNIRYDRCVSDLCNFGLYLAGGTFEVIGGKYVSKRNTTLTIYTGDRHAKCEGVMIRPYFEIVPEVGSNLVGKIHCINQASTQPNYEQQQFLSVTMIKPTFVCNHGGTSVEIEEGSNVTMASPIFIKGGQQIETTRSALTGGPYRQGVVDIRSADHSEYITDAYRLRTKANLAFPKFRNPGDIANACVNMLAESSLYMQGAEIGTEDGSAQPENGVITSVAGLRAHIVDTDIKGLTGSFIAAARANTENWIVEGTTPADTGIVSKFHKGSVTYDPPSIAAGSSISTTVTVTGAVVGDIARASFSNSLGGLTLTAYVSSSNNVTVVFANNTGAAIDLASGTVSVITERTII